MSKHLFFIVGELSIPHKVVYEVIQSSFPGAKCYFIEKESYIKSRFLYAHAIGANVEAIFIGPVPHQTKQSGSSSSMASEIKIKNSITPVYKCTTLTGTLKFTKNSIRMALIEHLLRKKRKEDQELVALITFFKCLFPNQRVF